VFLSSEVSVQLLRNGASSDCCPRKGPDGHARIFGLGLNAKNMRAEASSGVFVRRRKEDGNPGEGMNLMELASCVRPAGHLIDPAIAMMMEAGVMWCTT
jgi:hypothetical protein